MYNSTERRRYKEEERQRELSSYEFPKLNLYDPTYFYATSLGIHSHCSYDRPPQHDVTIEEFESCALNRLRVLAEIESSLARNRSFDELKDLTAKQYESYIPIKANEDRRRDVVGHFVLRLAFCRSYVA